jgi:GT2 family glycosyltransferase
VSLIRYTFVIPTYRRPDVLELCLESIRRQTMDLRCAEILVIDNAEEQNTALVAEKFRDLNLQYFVNERNLGPGGSLNKGLGLAKGERIVIMNDDAILPESFLSHCDEVFNSDDNIGCLGFRVLEDNYTRVAGGVGQIHLSGEVIGNFDLDTHGAIDVEHIYGYCYAITRNALKAAGAFDTVLLARPYASGNRIETDHCLSIRRAGFRVVYDSRLPIQHLAKPRLDIGERSLKWRLNEIRNTLYLFLKHYGFTGKRCLAIRYVLSHDLGIRSALLHPSQSNANYFLIGMRGRLSAIGHYFLYLSRKLVGLK